VKFAEFGIREDIWLGRRERVFIPSFSSALVAEAVAEVLSSVA